jgi:hypothetical protein
MKTEILIDALAADAAGPRDASAPAALRARALGAAALGFALSAAATLIVFGLRSDLAAHLLDAPVALKFSGSAAFAAAGLWLAARAAEPGRRLRPLAALTPLLAVSALFAALWPDTRAALWVPPTDRASLLCAASVALLALAPLGGLLAVLRSGAPTRPALAGAAAGLAAGGLGAAGYALHCPIDLPGYVVAWYPAGIGLAALIGAAAGRRVLVW